MTRKQKLLALEAALLVARHEFEEITYPFAGDTTYEDICERLLSATEAILDLDNQDGTFGQTLIEQAESCVLLAQAPEVFGVKEV